MVSVRYYASVWLFIAMFLICDILVCSVYVFICVYLWFLCVHLVCWVLVYYLYVDLLVWSWCLFVLLFVAVGCIALLMIDLLFRFGVRVICVDCDVCCLRCCAFDSVLVIWFIVCNSVGCNFVFGFWILVCLDLFDWEIGFGLIIYAFVWCCLSNIWC